MENYKFKLSFSLPGFISDASRFIDEKSFAGMGITIKHLDKQIFCSCSRKGEKAFRTIRETTTLIQDAIPDATLSSVAPDLIPEKTACNLLKIGPAKFKALRATSHFSAKTITQGEKQLWHLKELLDWMQEHRGDQVNPVVYETAEAAYHLNANSKNGIEKPRNTSSFSLPEKYSARSFEAKAGFTPNIYR